MLISFRPALYLPSPDKVTIAVRCCPTLFELRKVPRELSEGRYINWYPVIMAIRQLVNPIKLLAVIGLLTYQ